MANPNLLHLVEAPTGGSLPYLDPLFPDRPLVLRGHATITLGHLFYSCIMGSVAMAGITGIIGSI